MVIPALLRLLAAACALGALAGCDPKPSPGPVPKPQTRAPAPGP